MDAVTFGVQLVSVLISLLAFAYAAWLYLWVKRLPSSNARIAHVGRLIREGARTFLRKEYLVLARFALAAGALIFLFLPSPLWSGSVGENVVMTVAYFAGTVFSAIAGKTGIEVATIANIKAAEAAQKGIRPSFMAGFRGGAVMGMAMGTSEAVGYVDQDGNVLGWLNELAFTPVDLNEAAMVDEWSTDRGVGCKYFSQDAVIKLAPAAGIQLDQTLTPAEKLKVVQGLMEQDDPRAAAIYDSIGAYLAYTVVLYSQFYEIHHLIALGRVMSGKGGELILARCQAILAQEYPQLAGQIRVMLPDEKTRRVGQSVAAASLPE